jgi:hypothetical protein
MREIKFRAWDEHDLDGKGAMICWELILEDGFHNYYGAPGVILMQFTGLKDKNGKEMYEGDVVKSEFGEVGKIVFTCGAFLMEYIPPHDWDAMCPCEGLSPTDEVIGNIYDNPELLSGTTLVQVFEDTKNNVAGLNLLETQPFLVNKMG